MKYGFSFSEILLLVDAGLIQPGSSLRLRYLSSNQPSDNIIFYNNVIINLNVHAFSTAVNIPVWAFTQTGNELYKMVDFDFLGDIISEIKSVNEPNVSFSFARRDKVPCQFVSDLKEL